MFEDEYERVRLLGEGAFGAAYLVRSKTSGVQQVAKEIRIAHLTDKQRETALAESEVLRQMNHSNIVAYIASFLEGPKLYIVMEFADGGNLADKIAQRKDDGTKFEERDIMFTFVQVSLALLHIHARKTVHRDLKPLNIFLTIDGIVKLGDFGIAKVMDSTTSGAQTTIGTPFYLSPEICNNEAYGVKSDLWSLGVVTFELAHLRVPFHANSLPATALKILGADPDPLPEMYTKDLQWIVDSFLQKDPKDRPRLDHVMKMPYVQKHIQGLKDHVKRTGTGGCEAMVIRRRSQEPDIPKDVILEVSGSYPKADKRRMDAPAAPARGSHDRAGAGADADAARHRRRDPEAQQQNRAQVARQAAHDEFFRTRQAAEQTKKKVEAAMREEAEKAKQEQGLRGEERKAQVRQKAQDERQEKEAARLQELEQARRQVKADNQRLIERKQGGAGTAKGGDNSDSKQHSSGQHEESPEEDGSATMKFEEQGDNGASTQRLPVPASEAEEDALRDALLEPEDGNSHGNADDDAAFGAATIGFMSPGPEAAAEVHALEEALAGILDDGASTMKLDGPEEDGASTMKFDGNDQEASLEDGRTVRADELADELADNELGSRTLGRDELGSAEEVEAAKTLRQTEDQLQTTIPPAAAASAAAEAEEEEKKEEEEDASPQPQQEEEEEEPEEEGLMDFSTLFFDKAKPKPKLSSENRRRPERLEKTTGHPTVTRITSPGAEGPMSKTAGPSRHAEGRKEQRAATIRKGEPKGEGHQHQQPHHAQPKRRAQGAHAHAEVALEQHRGPAASASAASLRSGGGAGAGTGSSAASTRNRGGPAQQGGGAAAQPKGAPHGNGASGSSRSAASGTPAHWLRRPGATPEPQRPRAGDACSRDSSDEVPNGRRRANKTQTAPGGGGAGGAKSSAQGKSAKAPNGGATLAQLEDALASALCSTDGVHEQDDKGATIKLPAGKASESDMGSTSRTLASTRAPGTHDVGGASGAQSSDSDG